MSHCDTFGRITFEVCFDAPEDYEKALTDDLINYGNERCEECHYNEYTSSIDFYPAINIEPFDFYEICFKYPDVIFRQEVVCTDSGEWYLEYTFNNLYQYILGEIVYAEPSILKPIKCQQYAFEFSYE